MPVRRSSTTYAAIRTEGGLLPPDLLDRILVQNSGLGGFEAKGYGLSPGTRLMAQMSEAWQAIQLHYASFRHSMERIERDNASGTSETRHWVQSVLRELGYRELRFVSGTETIDGRSFLISHRADDADNALPIHIVSFRQGLDDRAGRTGGGVQRSPHALMQGYLNTSDHLWGVVTNGLVFRVLRENRQIDRVLRTDFDLAGMLESESFAEFQLFWLVLHRSRFVLPGEPRETAWLERWSQAAASEGTRALSALRNGVETAIEAFGQGLLSHPDNQYLRTQLNSGALSVDAYYSELLRLVYRLLFLLVAEERHLLFPVDAEARSIERYRSYYSIERLRNEAARLRNRETHQDDLWRGLLVTFDAMRYPKEAETLGLAPLGGGLFGAGSCPHIADDAAPGTLATGDRTAGRPMLSNAALLDAVQALSEVTRDGTTRRINYRDLDVEELGSVYEGLLEHRPALAPQPNGDYRFGFGESTSRKETGSYYTPRSLVQALLDSALDPVIDAAMTRSATPGAQERALVELKVCDPSCGSGHFLLGAARRIGRRLAQVRAGAEREPETGELRRATAEAIRHCVYGVDKNPLAIDLCKVALWIESHEPGGPVGFLDHHIKRGDSLVGVFDLDVLTSSIPDDAFTAVSGDDNSAATDLKKRNRSEKPKSLDLESGDRTTVRSLGLFDDEDVSDIVGSLASRLDQIDAMPDATAVEVAAKADAYARLHGRDDWRAMTQACDLWTYAFFAPLKKGQTHMVPTSATVRTAMGGGVVSPLIAAPALAASSEVGFFHWKLEFPEVFREGREGFDTVLGNPPWEQVQPEERKYFANRDLAIASAAGAKRKAMIAALKQNNPELLEGWNTFVRLVTRNGHYYRSSGRYPLTGIGKINLYSVFAEHGRNLTGKLGRAGIIVPTGIATDDTNKVFFADLVDRRRLFTLYDFENRKKVFEAVDSRMKFSLLVMGVSSSSDNRFPAAFFMLDPLEIHEAERTYTMTPADIAFVNPNTKTSPICRTRRDLDLLKAIHRLAPVLVNESLDDAGSPWGVTFKQGLFNMTSDSGLFRTQEDLEAAGANLGTDGRFHRDATLPIPDGTDGDLVAEIHAGVIEWLPLYEAKLIHQYDHRFATFNPDGSTRDVTTEEHADPNIVVTPRYWVSRSEVERASPAPIDESYFFGFRLMLRSTDASSAMFQVLPQPALGHSGALLHTTQSSNLAVCLLANLNCRVLEYIIRNKVGGANFSFFIVKQLPVLSPETYTKDLLDRIVPRVLELTYTAWDIQPFARDLGYKGDPFIWDEDRRAQIRADIDGIYAHLYGISRDDFAYILNTFPIVARKDIAEFGEYRTKRLCLEAYDHFAPETLRALELDVRNIEQELRRIIVYVLDNDSERMPGDLRNALIEERAKHRGGDIDGQVPPLRELLEASYMPQLSKIVRSDAAWPVLADRFGSKSQFEKHFGRLTTFRNPLAHGRSVDEDVRRNGEEAIAWFKERLNAHAN